MVRFEVEVIELYFIRELSSDYISIGVAVAVPVISDKICVTNFPSFITEISTYSTTELALTLLCLLSQENFISNIFLLSQL